MAHVIFLWGSAVLGSTRDMTDLRYLEISDVRSRAGVLDWNSGSPLHTHVALDKFYSLPSPGVLLCKMERVRVAAALGGYEIAYNSGCFKASYEYFSLPFAPAQELYYPRVIPLSCPESQTVERRRRQQSFQSPNFCS